MAVRFDAVVTGVTVKALCCFLNNDRVNRWIPRGQLCPGTEVSKIGDKGQLIVNDWFAREARLPEGQVVEMGNYTDSGLLFSNRDKKDNEKSPDYLGNLDITCEHCGAVSKRPLAGWAKVARNSAKYLALSCKPKSQRAAARQQSNDAGLF